MILHRWDKPLSCNQPHRGTWGGPPNDGSGNPKVEAALDLAFAPRGKVKLAALVAQDVPAIGVSRQAATEPAKTAPTPDKSGPDKAPGETKSSKGCQASSGGPAGALFGAMLALGLIVAFRRRRG